MVNSPDKKKNKTFRNTILILFFLVLLIGGAYFLYVYQNYIQQEKTNTEQIDSAKILAEKAKYEADFKKSVTSNSDTNFREIISSSPGKEVPFQLDGNTSKPIRMVYNGRRINIAVTGLDSRLGTRSNHADANHVISILIDSGLVEIISVPRDTPAEAGMPDSSGQNKLTVVRAVRGREAYLKELANIINIDKIHYWVEGGFSQVMGIIEFFGFRDSRSALQVLRSRVGLGGDDFQRAYNQAQFIRQMLLRHFNKFKGITGELLIRGSLALIETNLTTSVLKEIVQKLESKNFPTSPDAISVKIRPPMGNKFKVYDFTQEDVFQNLKNKIENFNKSYVPDSAKYRSNPAQILRNVLAKAYPDTAKKPQNVIKTLQIYFEQHAWLQVPEISERTRIRNEFALLLSNAYMKKKQAEKARQVLESVRLEEELFKNKIN